MKHIYILSGHPNLSASVANAHIIKYLQQSFSNSSICEIARSYPNYCIDIVREQQILQNVECIIAQFPFFRYGVPSSMQAYFEQVFSEGFAYGENGNKLKGKKIIYSFTIGAAAEAYRADGIHGYPVEQFLFPLRQLAHLCAMSCDFVYSFAMQDLVERVKHRASEHATQVIAHINA